MTVLARLRAHWKFKLGLSVLLNALFWAGYGYLGRYALFPLRTIPLTWLDRNIPFQPEPWAWVYLSQFLLTGILPWLLAGRDEIRRYATSVGVLSLSSFLIFLFLPVASPRPDLAATTGAMRFIAAYDGSLNAFPSLHAGFLVLMARLAWRMGGPVRTPLAVTAGIGWGGAILYATLATRQHYALDLAAGAGLGWLADWLASRTTPRVAVAATTSRSSGMTFQAGCR
jgi:hypothetical protein